MLYYKCLQNFYIRRTTRVLWIFLLNKYINSLIPYKTLHKPENSIKDPCVNRKSRSWIPTKYKTLHCRDSFLLDKVGFTILMGVSLKFFFFFVSFSFSGNCRMGKYLGRGVVGSVRICLTSFIQGQPLRTE